MTNMDGRSLETCDEFAKLLNRKQKTAWNKLFPDVHDFLGNYKSENYVLLAQTIIKNFAKMRYRMSLKVHLNNAHIEINIKRDDLWLKRDLMIEYFKKNL